MRIHTLLAGAAMALMASVSAVSASADVLYANPGPANHNAGAYTLGYGYVTSNSFDLAQSSTLTGVTFDSWNDPGQVATSVDWAILDGSPQFGGSTLLSGTGALSAVLTGDHPYGYDIYTYSFSLASLALSAGTYWLSLANAQGAYATYWEVSNGGSLAYHSSLGPIQSESFQILGGAGVPEPAGWALMLTGFLGAGGALRSNRRRLAVATAA